MAIYAPDQFFLSERGFRKLLQELPTPFYLYDRSGIMMGNACMLDGMVQRMEEELGQKATVVITGGIAKYIAPLCKTPMIYDKDLLLKGLAFLYRENAKN